MKSFFAALTFLTTIPLPPRLQEKCDFSNCQEHFPTIGIIIGIIISLVSYIFYRIFPPAVAAALTTMALVIITGGLHIDGLSDTADGFLSHRDREKTLSIMKDSRIGSFGSLAQLGLILLKFSSLAALADTAYLAILFVPLTGRAAILLISHLFPPAQSSGLGYSMNAQKSRLALISGIAAALIISTILFGLTGLLSVLLALAAAYILGKISKRKIGGYTGDILGAGCEISEATALVILSISAL